MNATACSENTPKGYAYEATKECSTLEPDPNGNFDPEEMKKNVYKCDVNHEYLDLTGEKATCVTENNCEEHGYVFAAGEVKMCLSASQCTARDGYYVDEENGRCVSMTKCGDRLVLDAGVCRQRCEVRVI